MTKIDRYKNYIDNELKKIINISDKSSFDIKIKNLFNYHLAKVNDFQHERRIHLLVTLFFGFILILVTGTLVILGMLNLLNVKSYLLGSLIFAIIFVTEICYIFYYYYLENSMVILYKLTDQIYTIINQKN